MLQKWWLLVEGIQTSEVQTLTPLTLGTGQKQDPVGCMSSSVWSKAQQILWVSSCPRLCTLGDCWEKGTEDEKRITQLKPLKHKRKDQGWLLFPWPRLIGWAQCPRGPMGNSAQWGCSKRRQGKRIQSKPLPLSFPPQVNKGKAEKEARLAHSQTES